MDSIFHRVANIASMLHPKFTSSCMYIEYMQYSFYLDLKGDPSYTYYWERGYSLSYALWEKHVMTWSTFLTFIIPIEWSSSICFWHFFPNIMLVIICPQFLKKRFPDEVIRSHQTPDEESVAIHWELHGRKQPSFYLINSSEH